MNEMNSTYNRFNYFVIGGRLSENALLINTTNIN